MFSNQQSLVERPPKTWPYTRNNPKFACEVLEPVKQTRVFIERNVIKERITAVKQAGNPAPSDVTNHEFALLKINRARLIVLET